VGAVGKWAAGVLAAALLVTAVVVTPRLWLRTAHGHRTVERVLDRILNERVPGSVSVGRLRGSVLTDLAADDVVVRNPAGEIIGRAPVILARWRPIALVRHRVIDAVHVERPEVVLDRARWRIPPPPPTPPRRARRTPPTETVIAQLTVRGGRLAWRRTTLTGIDGAATLRSTAHLDVRRLSARVAGAQLHAFGTVGWRERPVWVATRFAAARGEGLKGRGRLFYTRGRLDGDLEELVVPAPIVTRLVGGRSAVRLSGHVEGRGDDLRAEVRAEAARRAPLRLHVVIDRRHREATIAAQSARPVRRLRARLRVRSRVLWVSSLQAAVGASRLDGSGAIDRRTIRAARLHARLMPSEARRIGLRTRAPIVVELEAAGPLRALLLRGRARHEAAQVAARARVDVPARAGEIDLAARAVQAERVWPGAPPITVSGRFRLAGRLDRRRLVGVVRVEEGEVAVDRWRLFALAGDADVQLAREGTASIRGLSGRGPRGRFAVRGTLAWTRERVTLTGAALQLDGAYALGDARYDLDEGRLVVRADPVSLSPALVARALGRRPARALTGRVAVEGTRGALSLAIAAPTPLGEVRAVASAIRAGPLVEVTRIEAHLGDSRLVAAARYRAGRVEAAVEDLALSPPLVTQLEPALRPEWPIHVRGAIAGRRDGLDVTLSVDAGPSTARLRGRIAARAFRLVGHLDTFDLAVLRPTARRVRATLELATAGRLEQGGVVGTLTIRGARGYFMESPFARGWADARFEGRALAITAAVVDFPGARLVGSGDATPDGGLRFDYGVVITNALKLRRVPPGLRTLLGINSILPGRTVKGTVTKRPGQKVEITRHVLPIGVSQLDFLIRVLTGRLPRFERRL
jgi:hypothetical protein